MTRTQKRFVVLAVLSAFVLLPGVAKAQNLIAHWPMDDANDAISSTAGTLVGGASLVDGALVLDGVDDRLETNVAAARPNGTDGFTVSAWIKTTTTGIYWANKPPGDSVDDNQLILRLDSDGVFQGDMEGVGYVTSGAGGGTFTDDQWHHVVLSMPAAGAGNSQWYLDTGTPGLSASVSDESLPDGSLVFIGWGTDTDDGINDYFTGSIDDVRIYDGPLDAAAVQALFDAGRGPAGGAAGPVEILGTWTEGLTHAAEAGADMLIFTVAIEGGPDSDVSSVTYGGQAMTEIIDAIVNPGGSDTEAYVTAWYLNGTGITAASSGDFVVTWAATEPSFELYTSVFLSGVDQTNPIGGSTSDTAEDPDGTTTGAPLSTNDGDLVIGDVAGGAPQGFDWLNAFTEQIGTTGGSAGGSVASKAATGADETVEASSPGNFRMAMIGFVVQAGGGGAGPPPVPPAVDTDGDGFLDPVEVALGFDPNDAGDAPPATPVAGILGLGLLSLGVLAGGAALVRRKK